MQQRIKVFKFYHDELLRLEAEVNEWLSQHPEWVVDDLSVTPGMHYPGNQVVRDELELYVTILYHLRDEKDE